MLGCAFQQNILMKTVAMMIHKMFSLFDFKKQMKPPTSFSHCSHYATREYCQLMLMLSSSEMYVASGCFLILKHVVLFWGEMFFGQVLIERHYKIICRLT